MTKKEMIDACVKIEKAEKIAAAVKNFRAMYETSEGHLYGNRDGGVDAETLLAFLIENPCLNEVAKEIGKLLK